MSDLYGVPQGGIMGLLSNPNTASLLGMAGGLLQASGPSRMPVSNGQALGMGLSGMGEGFNNALQMQRGLMQMRMMQGLMGDQGGGGAPGSTAPASASQPMAPVGGSANVGPLSGLSAGMGGMAPTPAASAAAASAAYPSVAPSGPMIGEKSPDQLMRQGMQWNMVFPGSGNAMISAALSAQAPTDAQKMAGAAYGYGTPEYEAAIQSQVRKAGYQAPLNSRPGTIIRDPYTMQPLAFNPNVPAGGAPLFDASGNVAAINMIPGATGVTGAMAAAKTAGEGSALPYAGVDAKGNPLPVTNRTAAATQGIPGVPGFTPFQNAIRTAESAGNPAAVNPASGAVGSMQTLPTTATNPGFGVTPARDMSPAELQRVGGDYAAAMQKKYGNDTDAAVAYNWGPQNADKWISAGRPWNMLPPETQSYVGHVMTQMQNYKGAQAAPTPQSGGAATTAPSGSAIYAAPPLGATTAANLAQGAPGKQMADMQQHLADSDNTYQASRQALLKMIGITQNGGMYDAAMRMLPESVNTRVSNDAAEYQKAHSNFVSLQGKALGAGGTDTSRATLDESVPTFEKPTEAKISGLTDQLNQLDWNHLKRQTLNPVFTNGNEKAYSDLSAKFDSTIPTAMMPKLMPILGMPAGAARTQAIRQAIQDPQMKSALDLMVQTGQLK